MATPPAIHLPTAMGPCLLGWSPDAITRVVLPPASPPAEPHALDWETTEDLPAFVREAAQAITLHLAGEPQALERHPVAFADASAFAQAVWRETQRIPSGETRSYGEIAQALGKAGAARAVGRALGANPVPLLVPCHRVVGGRGQLVGFSATGGVSLKARLLALERNGAQANPGLPPGDPASGIETSR